MLLSCDSCDPCMLIDASLPCAAAATGDMEFVMSMNTSNIAPTFQIHPEQKLRIKARYDATVRHTGDHHAFNQPVYRTASNDWVLNK